MEYEYKNDIRDRISITAKANESIRKNGQPKLKGKPSWNTGKKGLCPQFAKFGKSNPMYGKLGKAHHGYKTGASIERKRGWGRSKYQSWRRGVFARDYFTCQICGDDKGGNLHAHHVKPWALDIDGRYDITNGITLCEMCHIGIHKKTA